MIKNKKHVRNLFVLGLISLLLLLFMSETSTGFYRRRLDRYLARIKLVSIDPFGQPGKDRLLIIAPHPDDETIAAAGMIQQAKKDGDTVHIVLVTNGDYFGDVLDETIIARFRKGDHGIHVGYKRQQESIDAMKVLGLDSTDITFLGYPDNGISKLWFENWESPYWASHTRTNYSPYDNSYTLDTSYTGKNLANDMAAILDNYRPTIIVCPSYYDFHPDHRCSTNFLISELGKLKQNNQLWTDQIKIYYYLVHYGKLRWPRPWGYFPNQNLVPPESFLPLNLEWYKFPLEQNFIPLKKEALDQYKSQIKLIGPYLLAFVRKQELMSVHDWEDQEILDPTGDFISKDLLSGSDFISMQIDEKPDQVVLKSKTSPLGIPGITNYILKIVLYERKANGTIQESRLKWKLDHSNAVFHDHQIDFKLNRKAYPGLVAFYVTVESYPRFSSLLIDKIPWTFYRLKR